ncbi:MAG: hypothetical protein KIT73_09245 [Burkholderiales bacterium]|nr:hypothetical protein [Burkholderiales bacterium]
MDTPVVNVQERQPLLHFRGCTLASVFQSVLDARTGLTVAHQGLVRSFGDGERVLSPWSLLAHGCHAEALSQLHEATAWMHAATLVRHAAIPPLLILSVDPVSVEKLQIGFPWRLRAQFAASGLPAERVMLVLDDAGGRQRLVLLGLAQMLRECGFRVGLRCRPDRVDGLPLRGFELLQARWDPSPLAIHGFARLARQAEHVGAVPAASHVERDEDVAAAVAAGAVWLQGHAVARPAAVPTEPDTVEPALAVSLQPRESDPDRLVVPPIGWKAPAVAAGAAGF